MLEPQIGDGAGGGLERRQRADARVLETVGLHALGFDQAGGGARLERRHHELAPVGGMAGPGDEGIARLDPAAVGAQHAGGPFAQPAGGGGGGAKAGQHLSGPVAMGSTAAHRTPAC